MTDTPFDTLAGMSLELLDSEPALPNGYTLFLVNKYGGEDMAAPRKTVPRKAPARKPPVTPVFQPATPNGNGLSTVDFEALTIELATPEVEIPQPIKTWVDTAHEAWKVSPSWRVVGQPTPEQLAELIKLAKLYADTVPLTIRTKPIPGTYSKILYKVMNRHRSGGATKGNA